jgi:hypothetical protein
VYLGARRTPHNDIKAWVKRYAPPVCALMADKLPDPAANAVNQAAFANLSRMLLDNQIVSLPARVSCSHHRATHTMRSWQWRLGAWTIFPVPV